MDPWRKETLGLEVGDFIIWQGEAIEVEGQSALVAPGIRNMPTTNSVVNAFIVNFPLLVCLNCAMQLASMLRREGVKGNRRQHLR